MSETTKIKLTRLEKNQKVLMDKKKKREKMGVDASTENIILLRRTYLCECGCSVTLEGNPKPYMKGEKEVCSSCSKSS